MHKTGSFFPSVTFHQCDLLTNLLMSSSNEVLRWSLPCRVFAEVSGTEQVNMALSGSAWIGDIQSHSEGEFRGLTKLVNITEDVRKYAAEQGIAEDEALRQGMVAKSKEFLDKGVELYQKPDRMSVTTT
jgi:phosphomethylpyrimidine synthase